MSLDRQALAAAVDAHGRVARVLVTRAAGSVPRDPGTSMLVWDKGQEGTIGGGALELAAVTEARAILAQGIPGRARTIPLGPGLGQCCGGSVTLAWEVFDAATLPSGLPFARPKPGTACKNRPEAAILQDPGAGRGLDATTTSEATTAGAVYAAGATPDAAPIRAGQRGGTADPLSGPMPARVRARLASMAPGQPPAEVEGWLLEAAPTPRRAVWIHGAGHVGRALVAVLSPLPDLAITWTDTGPERFPDDMPASVTPVVAADPAAAVPYAPRDADHLILTYSHEIDLALCHALLRHGFGSAGLIGSATKWARFRKRLVALGHSPAQISRIACPIGDTALGRHPQAIAVGVAVTLLRARGMALGDGASIERERAG